MGWQASEITRKFLDSLKTGELEGVKSASFDTRMKVWYCGDAAKKITRKLENAGAKNIVEPKAFYVAGKEGPLLEGEIKMAKKWAKIIKEKLG